MIHLSWLAYALLARFFWACSNLSDQYVTRFSGHKSTIALMITGNIVLLPIILLATFVLGIPVVLKPVSMLWLGVGVIANMASLYPYYVALKKDDAHNIVPLLEMIPVFVTLLAYVLFRDKLTGIQLLGAALVVGSGFLFSWDFRHGHVRIRTLKLIALGSFLYALYLIALRYGVKHESVWSMLIFVYTGFFVSALVLLAVAREPRRLFFGAVRNSKGGILAVALTGETLAFFANGCIILAFAHAPKAGQVAALSGIQPIFVLLNSVLLGFILPRFYQPLSWDKDLKIKCLLLFVIAGGVALLNN